MLCMGICMRVGIRGQRGEHRSKGQMHTCDHGVVCESSGRNGDVIVQEGPKGDSR